MHLRHPYGQFPCVGISNPAQPLESVNIDKVVPLRSCPISQLSSSHLYGSAADQNSVLDPVRAFHRWLRRSEWKGEQSERLINAFVSRACYVTTSRTRQIPINSAPATPKPQKLQTTTSSSQTFLSLFPNCGRPFSSVRTSAQNGRLGGKSFVNAQR